MLIFFFYILLAGDETISLISDTWSTDVLASDSENMEQNQSINSATINAVLSSSDALAMFQNANFPQVMLNFPIKFFNTKVKKL